MANRKKGFIYVYRSLFEHALWQSSEPFDRRSAWIDLIGMAYYDKQTRVVSGRPLKLKRGQLYVTLRFLASRWHWSREKVRHYISTLCEMKMLTASMTPRGTVLTVVKYSFFQGGGSGDVDTFPDTEMTQNEPQNGHIRSNVSNLSNGMKETLGGGGGNDRIYQ